MSKPPRITGILETSVYVADLHIAHGFYSGVLGLPRMLAGDRLAAYDVAPGEVLLVFLRGATREDLETPGGMIPGHHSDGPSHFAFKIVAADLDDWRDHLTASGVTITSEVLWPAGGSSLYFNDPDGNVLELAAPPNWPNFLD